MEGDIAEKYVLYIPGLVYTFYMNCIHKGFYSYLEHTI